jgi:hypothetical protein
MTSGFLQLESTLQSTLHHITNILKMTLTARMSLKTNIVIFDQFKFVSI